MPIARPLAALAMVLAVPAGFAQDGTPARGLAATCASCHGTNGHARGSEFKTLAGMPADQLLAQLADFRSGARPATVMHQISRGYTDEQLRLIAVWFAAQPARP